MACLGQLRGFHRPPSPHRLLSYMYRHRTLCSEETMASSSLLSDSSSVCTVVMVLVGVCSGASSR